MVGGERVLRVVRFSAFPSLARVCENSLTGPPKPDRSPMPEVLALACYLDWCCTLCDLIFVGLLDGRISQTDK